MKRAIDDLDLGLVVVDGVGYWVTGGGYTSVGAALTGLGSSAERTGCAILGLTHPPREAPTRPPQRPAAHSDRSVLVGSRTRRSNERDGT